VTVPGCPGANDQIPHRPGHALVERLFVDPKETGAGLGRHLLAHCIAVAAAENLELSLEVADNCHAAIALYARTGWREAGRTPISWGCELASELVRFESPARRSAGPHP
jgi:GNAT superfamily N-acetyltransferase